MPTLIDKIRDIHKEVAEKDFTMFVIGKYEDDKLFHAGTGLLSDISSLLVRAMQDPEEGKMVVAILKCAVEEYDQIEAEKN
ncbi:MAG: hypothetical protein ACUZ8H_16385 [Candidatus Anammoxibacter sp.]